MRLDSHIKHELKERTSARRIVGRVCMDLHGKLYVDYESGEVVCKLPQDIDIRAINDLDVEIYSPELGTIPLSNVRDIYYDGSKLRVYAEDDSLELDI